MSKIYFLAIVLAIAVLIALASCTGGSGPYAYGRGGGMMGGGGGMMGPGMMGGRGWNNYNVDAKPITIDQAIDSTQLYLNSYGDKLIIAEVMNFAQNYYAEAVEKDTSIHAMEGSPCFWLIPSL